MYSSSSETNMSTFVLAHRRFQTSYEFVIYLAEITGLAVKHLVSDSI